MPWSPKQKRFFRSVKHGFKPSNRKLRHLTASKARELLDEGSKLSGGDQNKALRLKKGHAH